MKFKQQHITPLVLHLIIIFTFFSLKVSAENKSFKSFPNYVVVNAQNFTPPNSQITVECWLKAHSIENWAAPISYITDNGHNESGFALAFVNNKLCFMLKTANMRGDEWNYNPAVQLEINQWIHIAGTYDGESIKIYKNGELIESKTTSGLINWIHKPANFYIGAFKDFNERLVFDGEIDEVRFWNTSRTSEQIKNFLTKTLSGNEEGLITCYNFNTDNNSFIKDLSPSTLNARLNIPSQARNIIPSGAMIIPKVTGTEVLSPSSLKLEWEIQESTFSFEHYIVELSNTRNFDRVTNTIKTSEKKITIDNINGGAPIFIRIKGFCKDFGYTAYSFSQELNAFETALSVSIYSKGKNGNNTKQILADHNILMTDYVSFPPSNKDIRFEMKLANQNPANLVPGKITIKGSSRNYTTEFTQKAELSLFDLKAGKYDIKITWGGDSENQNPLSANLRMEIKPSFFQQLYVKVILVLMLLSVFYMGWSRYKIVSRKLIIYNEQQEHSDIQEKEWISKEELEEKAQLIKETVTTEKLYLDPKFNLKSLANKLDIPHYHVSRILKEYYHQNFNDFTNEFRVNEFVRIQKEEKSKNIKISTLSYQCGFYSESTFFRAFKKFMGKTPQQYQKELEKNQEG